MGLMISLCYSPCFAAAALLRAWNSYFFKREERLRWRVRREKRRVEEIAEHEEELASLSSL